MKVQEGTTVVEMKGGAKCYAIVRTSQDRKHAISTH